MDIKLNPRSVSQPGLVLAVETSCDDTACAVVDSAGRVLSSVVSSQLVHVPYGGVVPELASREHLSNWPLVYQQALDDAGVTLEQIDLVAATRGPGLIGALLVGLHVGKALAFGRGCEFRAVHHLEGHLYSPFLRLDQEPALPVPDSFVGLVVSGGHTSLVRAVARCGDAASGHDIEPLGETRDDAMGEAMDKIGKRVGLPFPGGPHVDRLAELATDDRLGLATGRFKVPRCAGTVEFSYSGLKTQALRELEALERQGIVTVADDGAGDEVGAQARAQDDPTLGLPPQVLTILAQFRAAAVQQLVDRLNRVHRQQPIRDLAVSGGVAACRELRRRLDEWATNHSVTLHLVPLKYCGDNAAMIAFAALRAGSSGREPQPNVAVPWSVRAQSRLRLGS